MNDDLLSRLERLAKLKEQGAITDAEFERQKAELMSNTPKAAPVPEKKKSKAKGCLTVIVALILLGVITRLTGSGDKSDSASGTDSTSTISAPEGSTRKQQVDGFFSAFDGSHPGLEKSIKASMNDPDSYDHVSTRFRDDSATIYVETQFRGKNAFGGTITNYAKGKLDGQTGRLLEWEFIKQ